MMGIQLIVFTILNGNLVTTEQWRCVVVGAECVRPVAARRSQASDGFIGTEAASAFSFACTGSSTVTTGTWRRCECRCLPVSHHDAAS